jgi:hypothetical protein
VPTSIGPVVRGCGCYGREPGIRRPGPGRAVVVATELTAMAVLPAVMLPGVHAMLPSVHVTFPGVPLAAVVPAAPPAAGSRRPGRDLRGGSGLGGGSGARGCTWAQRSPDPPQSNEGRRTTGPAGAAPSHGDRGPRRSWPGGAQRCPLPSPLPRHQDPARKGQLLAAQPHPRTTGRTHAHHRAGRDHPDGPQVPVKRSVTRGHRPQPFNFCNRRAGYPPTIRPTAAQRKAAPGPGRGRHGA